jgi:hypothetical protein
LKAALINHQQRPPSPTSLRPLSCSRSTGGGGIVVVVDVVALYIFHSSISKGYEILDGVTSKYRLVKMPTSQKVILEKCQLFKPPKIHFKNVALSIRPVMNLSC